MDRGRYVRVIGATSLGQRLPPRRLDRSGLRAVCEFVTIPKASCNRFNWITMNLQRALVAERSLLVSHSGLSPSEQ